MSMDWSDPSEADPTDTTDPADPTGDQAVGAAPEDPQGVTYVRGERQPSLRSGKSIPANILAEVRKASVRTGVPEWVIVAVMQRENSSFNVKAKNVNTDGSVDHGLTQINDRARLADFGGSKDELISCAEDVSCSIDYLAHSTLGVFINERAQQNEGALENEDTLWLNAAANWHRSVRDGEWADYRQGLADLSEKGYVPSGKKAIAPPTQKGETAAQKAAKAPATINDLYDLFNEFFGRSPKNDAEAIGWGRLGQPYGKIRDEVATSQEAKQFREGGRTAAERKNRAPTTMQDIYDLFDEILGRAPKDDAEAIGWGRLGQPYGTVRAEFSSSPEAGVFRQYGPRIKDVRSWANALWRDYLGHEPTNDELRKVIDNHWGVDQAEQWLRSQPSGASDLGTMFDVRKLADKYAAQFVGRGKADDGEIQWLIANGKTSADDISAFYEQAKERHDTGDPAFAWVGDPASWRETRDQLGSIWSKAGLKGQPDPHMVNQAQAGDWTIQDMADAVSALPAPGFPNITVGEVNRVRKIAEGWKDNYLPGQPLTHEEMTRFVGMTSDEMRTYYRSLPVSMHRDATRAMQQGSQVQVDPQGRAYAGTPPVSPSAPQTPSAPQYLPPATTRTPEEAKSGLAQRAKEIGATTGEPGKTYGTPGGKPVTVWYPGGTMATAETVKGG